MACALGAEEFGFATAPLVALGCLMLRACNLDTCAAGIATQDPALRQGFQGKAEFVMAFMTYLAQEVREILAWLGLHSLEELVGRRDLLRVVETPGGPDVSPLLAPARPRRGAPPASVRRTDTPSVWRTRWTTACCFRSWRGRP